MLAPDLNHVWRNYCVAHEETLAHTWSFDSQALVSESQDRTLDAIIWFFERFGWEKAPRAVIREDMDNLLHRRI
jgi:hypothetical protein